MHRRIAELCSFIEGERAGVRAALAEMPPEWLERRPGPGEWTAAEVVDHLARVEQGVARIVERRVERALAEGLLSPETDEGSVLDRLAHADVAGDHRAVAPEIVRPAADTGAADALSALEGSRAALHAALTAADGYALGQIVQPHPVLGELDLYQWVLFVGLHERRHCRQLRAIARQLGTPPGASRPEGLDARD